MVIMAQLDITYLVLRDASNELVGNGLVEGEICDLNDWYGDCKGSKSQEGHEQNVELHIDMVECHQPKLSVFSVGAGNWRR
jgi:hypothetical protein